VSLSIDLFPSGASHRTRGQDLQNPIRPVTSFRRTILSVDFTYGGRTLEVQPGRGVRAERNLE